MASNGIVLYKMHCSGNAAIGPKSFSGNRNINLYIEDEPVYWLLLFMN